MSRLFSLDTRKELATYRWLFFASLFCAGCGESSSFVDGHAHESRAARPPPPTPTSPPGYLCALTASVRYGNLNIVGAAHASAYQCVTEIHGDVTVQGDNVPDSGAYLAGLTLALPNLRRVTGSLTIDSDHAGSVAFDSLVEVGGSFAATITRFQGVSHPPGGGPPIFATVVTSLSAPALASVGGDVTLHAQRDLGVNGTSAVFEFGLDALVTVGGSLLIDQPFLPGTPRGLRNLVTVPGNVVVNQPLADFGDTDLLTHLDAIGGDLRVTTNPFFRVFLPVLTEVAGQVALTSAAPNGSTIQAAVLPLLRTVGGDFSLSNYAPASCTALGSLAAVGGSFRINAGRLQGYYGISAGSGPAFGGIDIGGATGLLIPFHAGATVLGAGPVSFHGNTELCPCAVTSFAAGLTSSGWSGTVVNTGNGTSGACAGTCPQPTCP